MAIWSASRPASNRNRICPPVRPGSAEIRAALAEAQQKQATLAAETRLAAFGAATTWRHKRPRPSEQERVKAEQRGRLMHSTAPDPRSTVQQLAVHTVGGAVTPAQALDGDPGVPRDNVLEVEAMLPSKDIGFLAQSRTGCRGESGNLSVHPIRHPARQNHPGVIRRDCRRDNWD